MNPLPYHARPEQYQHQAEELLKAAQEGVKEALERLESGASPPTRVRAQRVVAHAYHFDDWTALAEFAEAAGRLDSPVAQFEAAVEAIAGAPSIFAPPGSVQGDAAELAALLRRNPELIRARSIRSHHATLLHYIAANGVEDYRQRSPHNAVAIARILLESGAEVDAEAAMYGGGSTTMGLLVSSIHPAKAGVQVPLVHLLLDFGAAIEGPAKGTYKWGSPLMTALAFGYRPAAEALAERGAKVDSIAAAAGLGRVAEVRERLASADAESRHRALALAAQHGQVEIVRLLLDAGEDPNRYNPDGNHAHSVPLHQAVCYGHELVVRLLVARGARLDIKDTIHHGTPLDWAVYSGQRGIEKFLRERS